MEEQTSCSSSPGKPQRGRAARSKRLLRASRTAPAAVISPILLYLIIAAPLTRLSASLAVGEAIAIDEDEIRGEKEARLAQLAELMNSQVRLGQVRPMIPAMAHLGPPEAGETLLQGESAANQEAVEASAQLPPEGSKPISLEPQVPSNVNSNNNSADSSQQVPNKPNSESLRDEPNHVIRNGSSEVAESWPHLNGSGHKPASKTSQAKEVAGKEAERGEVSHRQQQVVSPTNASSLPQPPTIEGPEAKQRNFSTLPDQFPMEILHDNAHESDKLLSRHREQPLPAKPKQELQRPAKPLEQPKLQLGGWMVPGERWFASPDKSQYQQHSSAGAQVAMRPELAGQLPRQLAEFQSAPQPQHVGPPLAMQTRERPTWPKSEPQVQVQANEHQAARLIRLNLQQQQGEQRQPLVSALKAKSFGLLPRLAAKLFSPANKQTDGETLNQQQSLQLPTHNAPQPQQPVGVRAKLFPKSGLANMKSLFSREPLAVGKLLPALARRPSQLMKGSKASAEPSNLSKPKLVLMNGQVYTVVSGEEPASEPFFDHQTSDTSEFPIFEAVSMQQGGSGAPVASAETHPFSSASAARPLRCDRPRHVIQADRSVVNHILQSQQNFVIARVPIRKYVRPEVSQHPLLPTPSHVYHAFPMPMAPSYTFAAATNRVPVMLEGGGGEALASPLGGPTFEVSASVPRHSIWHTLANLVSSLRRRPELPASHLVSGSSLHSVFMDGTAAPVFLAKSGRRRLLEPHRKRTSRRTFLWDEPSASASSQGLLDLQLQRLQTNQLEPQASQQQQQQLEPVDPMRRLLMLKTTTDNEVCSPVSQMGAKIKYSCVPNHCVAMALKQQASNQQVYKQQAYKQQVYKQQQQQQQASNLAAQEEQPSQQMQQPEQEPEQEHVQVQQFDDLPSHSPLVTYTHLNAYPPPEMSRLIQPQHQQFASSSQTLDHLANGGDLADDVDATGGFNQGAPLNSPAFAGIYQQQPYGFGQASNAPVVATNSGLIYMQIPASAGLAYAQGQHSVAHLTTSRPLSGSVTFGSAYIKPVAPPAAPERDAGDAQVKAARKTRPRKASEDQYGPSAHSVVEPNEFLSAVDEELERPIRVAKKRTNATTKATAKRNKQVKQDWPGRYQVNFEGSRAANSLVEKKQSSLGHKTLRQPPASVKIRAPLSSDGRQLRLLSGKQEDPDDPRNEDDDEEESVATDYDQSGDDEPQARAPQPLSFTSAGGRPLKPLGQRAVLQQPVNVSQPIPALRGGRPTQPLEAQFQQQATRERRTNKATPPTPAPAGPPRYGWRQSTPLPPPQKSDDSDATPPLVALAEEDSAANSTECDCSGSPKPAVARPAGDPSDSSDARLSRDSSDRWPPKRNPTSLRPNSAAQRASRPELDLSRPVSSANSSSANEQNPKDRRQTAAQHATGGASGRFTVTRRPYNLRNTTYKNLQLPAPVPASVQLEPIPSSAVVAVDGGGGDISTTVASTADGELWHQSEGDFNNQTHFDDNDPQVKHSINSYSQPNQADEQLSSNLLPGPEGAHPPPPLERFLELANAEDRLSRLQQQPAHRYNPAPGEAQSDKIKAAVTTDTSVSTLELSTTTSTPAPQTDASVVSVRDSKQKPASVNDIVAQAKGANGSDVSSLVTQTGDFVDRQSLAASEEAEAEKSSRPPTPDEDEQADREMTPHQYQIQVRWNNSTLLEGDAAAPDESRRQSKKLAGGAAGEAELALDRMKERVRDRLFEHREEEHWHDKKWLRAAKKRKLVAGRWMVVPVPDHEREAFDYGPHAHERDTPIKDQLPNEPSEAQLAQHFAIPTRNFRQSPQFVEWAQRDVNMDEEPGEPELRPAKEARGAGSSGGDTRPVMTRRQD